jgi:hypothetical protein
MARVVTAVFSPARCARNPRTLAFRGAACFRSASATAHDATHRARQHSAGRADCCFELNDSEYHAASGTTSMSQRYERHAHAGKGSLADRSQRTGGLLH